MKKLFSTSMLTVLLFVLCVALLPTKALAATVASGTCGDNLTWTLDSEGTLTISGSGEMANYNLSYLNTRPPGIIMWKT